MGRKVHPIGYRLKINKDWQGRWYAEGDKYTKQLHEDFTIRKMIFGGNDKASIAKVDVERFPNLVHVTIHTAKPGIVIGRKGAQVKVLRQDLEKLCGTKVKVDVNEITTPDLDAKLVADNIASQLERRISHARAMKRAVSQAMRAGAKGIKIMAAGRLAGSEMARREWQREGRVPLQTLRADIDFAKSEALTTYGRIGVKVWIYKGDVLKEEETPEPTDVYVSE
jgi:small subunit ribosomal protein S3